MNEIEIVRELRESCTCNEFAPPMVTNRELTEAANTIESLLSQLAERDREIERLQEAQEKIESCESCARYAEECYRFYTYPCSECKHRARDSYAPLPAPPEEGE